MDRRQERIRERAHRLWEEAGRPEGSDKQHWDAAEREIQREDDEERSATASSAAAPENGGTEQTPKEQAPIKQRGVSRGRRKPQ